MSVKKIKRNANDKFDKGDLEDELKAAGFDKNVADTISDNVKRKADNWTFGDGRKEAVRELKVFIESTQEALNKYQDIAKT